ncbi:MAG: enoyl-CoA hydratase [Rhodospirillales bacterium]|nr:enoyl-CoA hydratase [Rhodospirillales bacterium]
MSDQCPSDTIISVDQGVGLIQMNRPSCANALSSSLIQSLDNAFERLDSDSNVRVIILAGVGHHFSAGADINELVALTPQDVLQGGFVGTSTRLANLRKPVIAAVVGHAVGGGCELVEMCDIVVAADTARFGHPEVEVATMPGAGGTQRLTRVLGRHLALDMLLTGRLLSADEALRHGLVSRVVSAPNVMAEARVIANRIAGLSAPVVALIKEAVNQAGSSLAEGLAFERRLFALTLSFSDRTEGMKAFIEKRTAKFVNG